MNLKIFLLIAMILGFIGYFICKINKYQKPKLSKYTMINIYLYSLCLIIICLLTLLKIFSTKHCMYGVILFN